MSAIIRMALACLAWSLPLAVFAQTAPAPASSTGTEMMEMPGMASYTVKPVPTTVTTAPAPASSTGMDDMEMSAMPELSEGHDEHPAQTMHDMGGVHPMHDMRMQGGAAPADARSADYSDGLTRGDMTGMQMLDAKPLGMLRFDQLEAFHGAHGKGQAWELDGWYGTDSNQLWLRSEGEREDGRLGDADIEALWSHAVASYWDTQLGVRHDFGAGPSRQWLAFGVQGLAPYWFELEATAYVGPSGRTAARLRVEYELLFTQRLILQPEAELNFYGKADPQRRIGSGLSDANFGLRLRYEIRRQFAPYLGVAWTRRYGDTASFARAYHQAVFDRQIVAGLRIWF